MEFIQSIILGIVQGLSEFLPISSSAHLAVLPWIFNWQDQGLAFDVALHWGTLLAVAGYFRKEWIGMFKSVLSHKNYSEEKNKNLSDSNQANKLQIKNSKSQIPNYYQQFNRQLFFFIIIASIPAAVFGLFLKNWAETAFRSPLLIISTLTGFALVLWLSDKFGRKNKFLKNISWPATLIIGFSQVLAFVPGVSRSGITISAGLALGLERRTAARFSFLMATPVIFGAGLIEIPNLINNDINFSIIFIGVLTSAVAGFLSIKYLLRYLENHSYNIFVCYRIILALIILGIFLMR